MFPVSLCLLGFLTRGSPGYPGLEPGEFSAGDRRSPIPLPQLPRGSRSASIAVTSAFLEAYRQVCPGVMVDTLNVWEENLPDFDQEAIGAKYEGVNKEPMDQAETAVWDKIQELTAR